MTRRPTLAKRIVVDLDSQILHACEGAHVVFAFDCVTGDKNHQTSPGVFHIFKKDDKHVSHKYNVAMHYAMFFTQDGKAIHQYHGLMPLAVIRTLKEGVSDYLGSHGCVRLTHDDAKALYDWTPHGMPVHVQGRLT